MAVTALWQKLSGSINYYIRWVATDELLLADPTEVLADFMEGLAGEEDGAYEYLDKQTLKFIKLSAEDVTKIQQVFMERLERKKVKYLEQETF